MFGAGKSAYSLVNYFINNADNENWQLVIADMQVERIATLFPSKNIELVAFNIEEEALKEKLIEASDIVISMLPAFLHINIATTCLKYKKNLITPSYVSKEMMALDNEVRDNNLLFLNEVGLDPGIDHMSAMQIIDSIKEQGGSIEAFESFTGGLIAPESDTNPWHYKFTWNPRNVIVAGQGAAVKFLHNGKYKYIPYNKLFDRTEPIYIDGYGDFEGYANRDSLKYIDLYKLKGVKTMYRGTLRRPPFCSAWQMLVDIGATDDSYTLENSESMTYRDFINTFLKYREKDSVEIKLAYYLHKDVDGPEMQLLQWAGLFSKKKIGLKNASPAKILQHLFEKKWALEEDDKDMIVMRHLFKYNHGDELKEIQSSMVVLGEDEYNTAMAKTVGLPIGIATKNILNESITKKGVLLPLYPEIYKPILKELKEYGVSFIDEGHIL